MFSLLIKYIILICECLTYLLHNTIFSLVSLGIEDSKNPLKLYVEVDLFEDRVHSFCHILKEGHNPKKVKAVVLKKQSPNQ